MWQPADQKPIAWRLLDDELVVYNELTGNTHHLSALGSEVLLALFRHPSGIEMIELARDIADRTDLAADESLARGVERALAELTELHLARPASA